MPITRNSSGAPVASVAYFAANAVPNGWLRANGAQVSRTLYAALFNAIGTTYGAGNGSTTFTLPDLRGEFIRSLDDGRGVDSGRGIGTGQGDAIRNLTGEFSSWTRTWIRGPNGVFVDTGARGNPMFSGGGGDSSSGGISFSASNQVPTANENRPRNVAMLACIKF